MPQIISFTAFGDGLDRAMARIFRNNEMTFSLAAEVVGMCSAEKLWRQKVWSFLMINWFNVSGVEKNECERKSHF